VTPAVLRLVPATLRERWEGTAARPGGVTGWLHLRRLDARGLIQYFYVSLLQRAARLGWARRPGETPLEFSRELATRLPQQEQALTDLTEAFLRARYSPRPVADADAQRARRPWEEIRGALRLRRLRSLSPEPPDRDEGAGPSVPFPASRGGRPPGRAASVPEEGEMPAVNDPG
jgi:hypothetical protein